MQRVLERLNNVGEVYDGEELLGEYPYDITKLQNYSLNALGEEIPGTTAVKGRIEMDSTDIRRLDRKLLWLHLEGGHKLQFYFSSDDGTISVAGELK